MIQGGANIRAKTSVEVSPTAGLAAIMGVSGLDPGYVRKGAHYRLLTGSQKPLSVEHTAYYHYFIHGNKPRGCACRNASYGDDQST